MRWRVTAILLGLTAVIGYFTMSVVLCIITQDTVLGALTANLVTILITLMIRNKMRRHPFVQPRHVSRTEIALIPLIVVTVNLTATVTALWVKQHTGSTTLNEQVLGNTPVALVLLLGLIFAPLGEEALMRGCVYPIVRNRFSPTVTIAVTTVVFSLMHGNLAQITLTLPLGVVLGYLYERTHRLSLCVIAHSLFNLTAMLIPSKQIENVTVPIITTLATTILIAMWISVTQQMNAETDTQSQLSPTTSDKAL